jgi:hypothetical protein
MSLWQCVVQHCAASTIGYLAALAVLRMPIEFNLCSNTMTLRYFPCTTCNKIGIPFYISKGDPDLSSSHGLLASRLDSGRQARHLGTPGAASEAFDLAASA